MWTNVTVFKLAWVLQGPFLLRPENPALRTTHNRHSSPGESIPIAPPNICLPCSKKGLRLAGGWDLEQLNGKCFEKGVIRACVWPMLWPPPRGQHTQQDTHLFPFSVLVQHDHHQPGVYLIAFLSEGQVFAIPCHIDHKSRERKRERQGFFKRRIKMVLVKWMDATIGIKLKKLQCHQPSQAASVCARVSTHVGTANWPGTLFYKPVLTLRNLNLYRNLVIDCNWHMGWNFVYCQITDLCSNDLLTEESESMFSYV